MYLYPEETTALAPYNLSGIKDELSRVFITQSSDAQSIRQYKDNDKTVNGVWQLTPHNTSVSLFNMPIQFTPTGFRENNLENNMAHICYDIRPFTRLSPIGEVVISNPIEYAFQTSTALLTKCWVDKDFKIIVNNNQDFLLQMWVRWIANTLNQRLMVDDVSRPTVNTIIAYYLYCLMNPDEEVIDGGKLVRITHALSKASINNTTNTQELLQRLPRLTNINSLIDALKEHSGSTRFEKLTPGFLFTMIQYSWFGSAATIISSTALEYPPVFASMVYQAVANAGYKRTPLGKLVKELPMSMSQHYTKVVESLIYQ